MTWRRGSEKSRVFKRKDVRQEHVLFRGRTAKAAMVARCGRIFPLRELAKLL